MTQRHIDLRRSYEQIFKWKTSLLSNQSYHRNLLGKDFDRLVDEATDGGLAAPNPAANRNVIFAITQPSIGMELKAQTILQEVRKPLKSSIPKRQWLATVLIRDVLVECPKQIRSIREALMESICTIAKMDVSIAGQALRNAKEVAIQILKEHAGVDRRMLKTITRIKTRTRKSFRFPSFSNKEPAKSLEWIREKESSYRSCCFHVERLLQTQRYSEIRPETIEDWMDEIEKIRGEMTTTVDRLSKYRGPEIAVAIAKAMEIVHIADYLTELRNTKGLRKSESKLSYLVSLSPESDNESPNAIGLDVMDDLFEHDHVSLDPFQLLANRAVP